MKDPESMSPLAKALVAAERRRPDEPVAIGARVLARLETSVATGLGIPGVETAAKGRAMTSSVTPASSLLTGKALAVVAVAFASGVGTGVGLHAKFGAPASQGIPSTALVASASSPSTGTKGQVEKPPQSESAALPTMELERPSASVTPSGAQPVVSLRPRDVELSKERAIIERARMAGASRDLTEALKAVEEHRQQFPRGRLTEEREALAVRWLFEAQRAEEARARAKAFRARFPESVFLPSVEAALREK